MSWDVMIMRFPDGFDGDFEAMDDDWEPEELFPLDYFVEETRKLFPGINTEDKTWLILNAETYSIEFNMGDDDPVSVIALHVRGGDEALQAIETICRRFDCRALDTTESKLIDFSGKTNEGFASWRKYKNTVMKTEAKKK